MRIYTSSLIVLSVFTLSLSVKSQIPSHSSLTLLNSADSSQLLSLVKTGEAGPQSPSPGGQRRDFFQAGQMTSPQISHRGSGRREFSWA